MYCVEQASDVPSGPTGEKRLLDLIVETLNQQGIDAEWLPDPPSADVGADGHLRVRWDGAEHLFIAEVRATARPAMIELAGAPPQDAILLTEHVTPKLATSLDRAGWSGYADASGNVSLQAPGLLVRVEGRPPRRVVHPSTTLPFTRTGLPVTFALLVADARSAVWTQRDLARLTDTSLGTVNRVLTALRTSGHLDEQRRLRRPDDLAYQWTAAYTAAQPEAWPDETYSSSRWNAAVDVLDAELPDGALLGSELAAFRHGASIRPMTALVHCPQEGRADLIRSGRLRRDPKGTIAVRPAFWTPELVQGARTAPPFLVRADLLLADDPRLTEIARDRGMTWNDWT